MSSRLVSHRSKEWDWEKRCRTDVCLLCWMIWSWETADNITTKRVDCAICDFCVDDEKWSSRGRMRNCRRNCRRNSRRRRRRQFGRPPRAMRVHSDHQQMERAEPSTGATACPCTCAYTYLSYCPVLGDLLKTLQITKSQAHTQWAGLVEKPYRLFTAQTCYFFSWQKCYFIAWRHADPIIFRGNMSADS